LPGSGPYASSMIADITEFLDRGKHISILSLYGIDGFINYDYLEGGYDADDFLTAVEFMIVPHLRPYPQPGSILVIDNCRTHWRYESRLKKLVESVGAKLLFLAPYCPIDNPIEMAFSSFKACWRRVGHLLDWAPINVKIKWCIENCGSNGASARSTYLKCGYL